MPPKEEENSTIQNETKYHFFSDPNHGWLKVSRAELESLGISEKISECSYTKDEYVYLEEDGDAILFCDTKQKENPGWKLNDHLIEHDTNEQSPIRNYSRHTTTTHLQ